MPSIGARCHELRVAELLSSLSTPGYIARASAHDAAHVLKLKKIVKRAFEIQRDGLGFSLIEVLSTCPTNWGLSPCEATDWLEKNMVPQYPLGVVKDSWAAAPAASTAAGPAHPTAPVPAAGGR